MGLSCSNVRAKFGKMFAKHFLCYDFHLKVKCEVSLLLQAKIVFFFLSQIIGKVSLMKQDNCYIKTIFKNHSTLNSHSCTMET